jgi:hypothetical protein
MIMGLARLGNSAGKTWLRLESHINGETHRSYTLKQARIVYFDDKIYLL